jgi:hypothetical protein
MKAIKSDNLTWHHVCDFGRWNSPVVDLYSVAWIPTNYLIGPDGVIIAVSLTYEQLDAKLKELIK